jgi:hypothetical protein
MTYVRRQVAKFAYRKIVYALKKYLTSPAPVKIHGKNTIFMLTKPKRVEGKTQIGLILIGDFEESLIPEIEEDLTAGVATGYIMNLEQHQNLKFKADNLRIQNFAYQDYEFKHQEVGTFGAVVGQEIYKDRYMRKALKKTTKLKGVNWYDEFNDMLPRLKAKKYSGTPIIEYWEKMVTQNDWVIPIEVVRIWNYVNFYTGTEVQELANSLKNSILTEDESEFNKISKTIESFVKSEDKKRKVK